MKVFAVGLWLTIVALGSTFGAATLLFGKKEAAATPAPVALQSQKTRVLNVPVIREGTLGGYISVQFVYTMDAAGSKDLSVAPDVYLLDSAFRMLYADDSFDFRHLAKYDLGKFTRQLIEDTNTRLGKPLIKDILISDMNYTAKGQEGQAPRAEDKQDKPEEASGG